jgi:hypothetical protein
MRPALARREAKPPSKHARVDHQQHAPQRKNAEAPADADHEGAPDDPNAEAKADAPAEDAEMNGSNDFSDTGTDDPALPVHWSLWKYEELYDWLSEVVKDLPH